MQPSRTPRPPGLPGPGQPPRAASAGRPSSAPAALGDEPFAPGEAAAAPAMGSAPSPKAGGGAGDAVARWCSRTGSSSVGKGFSAWAPRTVNNKAGAAARDRYFPGSNKVGLAAFAPTPLPPRPGEITVCKNGAKWAESQGSVAVIAPPCRYDVSFSSAKLLVSCKACSRPGARRDGRVERCVLTGGSAEGRRARRARRA